MGYRQAMKGWLYEMTPPFLWRTLHKIFGYRSPEAAINYQGVTTQHSMRSLHEGYFAQIYDKFRTLNPSNSEHLTRLRVYNACMFADFCKGIPGDFLSAGISYGVTPRVIYDFVDFGTLQKTYHFIDPFTGVNNPSKSKINIYNTDINFILKQYQNDSPIKLHKNLIPDCFPLKSLEQLAFAHLNVTDEVAESSSIPYLYSKLSPGGIILIDYYCYGSGQFEVYEPIAASLGVEIFELVTGQGVIHKNFN